MMPLRTTTRTQIWSQRIAAEPRHNRDAGKLASRSTLDSPAAPDRDDEPRPF
jgi:hypothetical protein